MAQHCDNCASITFETAFLQACWSLVERCWKLACARFEVERCFVMLQHPRWGARSGLVCYDMSWYVMICLQIATLWYFVVFECIWWYLMVFVEFCLLSILWYFGNVSKCFEMFRDVSWCFEMFREFSEKSLRCFDMISGLEEWRCASLS